MLKTPPVVLVLLTGLFTLSAVSAACSSSESESSVGGVEPGGEGDDGGASTLPSPTFAPPTNPPVPDAGNTFLKDPPPKWCGPADGGTPPPPAPGGTEECPSDKNLPGCGCDVVGQTASCWTGLRANRNLGVCKDGTTTCTQLSENARGWGPCEGAVLPTPGVSGGKSACKCFSQGKWDLENAVPCIAPTYVVSTYMDPVTKKPVCPAAPPAGSPPVKPTQVWSGSTLTVDCAGHYELCIEMKAGDVTAPKAADCSLARVCVTMDYTTASLPQKLPPLPSWLSTDTNCAQRFQNGGYAEMSVKGLSVTCDAVDDGTGKPIVFARRGYCPVACATNPALPVCATCAAGGSGVF